MAQKMTTAEFSAKFEQIKAMGFVPTLIFVTAFTEGKNSMKTEICNECGKSVAFGSGFFVNRVVDLNDVGTRVEMGKPYPTGDFICAECELRINQMLSDERV
jgi:uncharacterized protein YlaI